MTLNPLVLLFGRLVARSGRKRGNRQTDGHCCPCADYYNTHPEAPWERVYAHAHCNASQEMAVAVRVVLFAALLGLYWSSSRVEGNDTKTKICIQVSSHLLNAMFRPSCFIKM